MDVIQTECRRCGTCCDKGGPALHGGDLSLIRNGAIPLEKLITIRQGELVNHPLTGDLQSVGYEVIKIAGKGRNWQCVYYANQEGCAIYDHRPSACRALKCWDTEEISQLVGKNTLSRLDILTESNPLRPLVMEYEQLCPCPDMEVIMRSLADRSLRDLSSLQDLVDRDLAFRDRVVREKGLSLALELFLFGRPVFQLLKDVGIGIQQVAGGIRLTTVMRNE